MADAERYSSGKLQAGFTIHPSDKWMDQHLLTIIKISKENAFTRLSKSVADPGGWGHGPPLAPIFEAPDYILRPKLHLFTLK